MARNTVPIIIGAVLFGLLAVGLTMYTLLGGGGGNPTPTPVADGGAAAAQQPATAGVLIARRPIYPRTVITRDMIEESDSAAPNPNAITNPYDVVGRLANRTIQAGQVLTTDSVTSGLGRVIPANIAIPAGLRGVAIWVDPTQTAAGLVDVGDRVDVIATHELQMEKQGNQIVVGATQFTAGRTIAQDLEVLAVDRSITESRPATPAPAAGQPAAGQPAAGQPGAPPAGQTANGQPAPAPTPAPPPPPPGQEQRTRVILAAPPEVAQRLVASNAQGKLHVTIRNPVARDRFPLPEAREYPSRLAAGAPAPGQQNEARTAAQERREDAELGLEVIKAISGRDQGTSSPPLPQPLPPFNPNSGATPSVTTPMPAPEKDVTVIRGTEKTRVIVPR